MQKPDRFVQSAEIYASGRSGVGVLFSSIARAHAKKTALVEGKKRLSYAELDDRSGRLAALLLDRGVKIGERVGILARNCCDYLVLGLAAAKCGAIIAAINWRLSERELHHCIRLVAPKMLFLQGEYRHTIVDLDLDPELQLIELGEELDALIVSQAKLVAAQDLDAESGLVILYTSGTTGMPKGALISHRAMVARASLFVSDLCLKRDANFVAWAPLYHMASTDHALATLMRGGTVFVVDGYQPAELMDIIEGHEIGWFVLMPGMVGDFAQFCASRDLRPKGITVCGAMADLVPRREIAAVTQALSAPYLNTFGATETGLAPATANVIEIGKAPKTLHKVQSAFIDLRLVDPQDKDVPIGDPGEVALRGAPLFSGYWLAEETNSHDFRNGWFHMGDVMRRNEDGTLDYVDRVKYMIKSGGENIYPAEIEQVLAMHPLVEEAVVVRQSDDKWGEVPVAFIVAEDLDSKKVAAATDVLEFCTGQLARYKRPKAVHFVDAQDLPRSTTGKIQRHILEQRLMET